MRTTSKPCDFNSAAVVEESTPPDMATTTLVSSGRPSRSRLLRMVFVVDARRMLSKKRKVMAALVSGASCRPSGAGHGFEKSLSNIGGPPPKQSRQGG